MIKDKILAVVKEAVEKAVKAGALGQMQEAICDSLTVDKTKNPEFGDYAVNVSSLARFARLAPKQIAENLKEFIEFENSQITIVNGFINFKLANDSLNNIVAQIIETKDDYGKPDIGQNKKVILEYISANPTGPLHIGHGRWAAMGSALANIMNFSNYEVYQEFYINDAGNQINNLAKSLWLRVLQELGVDAPLPAKEEDGSKNYYPGEYLIQTAKEYLEENKEKALELKDLNKDAYNPEEAIMTEMSTYAKAKMLEEQKRLLDRLKVHFDNYYFETSLHKSGKVQDTLDELEKRDKLYKKEGALWFKSSEYEDDQDRVITKKDGSYTYLTADIAYHYDKIQRGFDKLINIWGADHHGYVARMKASIQALGSNPDCLEVLLGQLVNLIIDGQPMRMGKRKKMFTLEELVDEVGVDATRFWMIMRNIDTTLDFDIDLAKSKTDENPVFYVQYAHARASSILRNATGERFDTESKEKLESFFEQEELDDIFENFNSKILSPIWKEDGKSLESAKTLILKLEEFNNAICNATQRRAPYLIAKYAQELASDFHRFYTFSRVLNVEKDLMKARLSLVFVTKQVLYNALHLLGVNAPESM